MSTIIGTKIHITGIVQGVGFRPFIYNLATRKNLTGWVKNTSAGVFIEVNGTKAVIEQFIQEIEQQAPPLARIDQIQIESCQTDHFTSFEIQASEEISAAFIPISPDVSICPACLQELFDPGNRRYLYPFINCTNCGPRFSILKDIPYDRPNTTMSAFPLCEDCRQEYHDPADRRFHAQPVACAVCGPHLCLVKPDGSKITLVNDNQVIQETQNRLLAGETVAIKGIGGFHLACDATNQAAVDRLRARKMRVDKPFAVMLPNLEVVERHCNLNPDEAELLSSRARPIVILRRKPESVITALVSPNQDTVGVMLPYTPLHYLLFHNYTEKTNPAEKSTGFPTQALVVTSGNRSEEPIAWDNDEALDRLHDLADAFLLHDRPIFMRCDDSVSRVFTDTSLRKDGSPQYLVRRSRGYAPNPVRLSWPLPSVLATGAELKNTFCLTRDQYAFVSHHIGDLENFETLQSFEEGIRHYERIFRIHPEMIAYDLHPNYLSTRYAQERIERESIPGVGIQHHMAHIASCMAENGIPSTEKVIGFAFDGTGYGLDGKIWGGEVFVGDYAGFERIYHLAYFPLPGGDAAIRTPARIALALLKSKGLAWEPDLAPVRHFSSTERQTLRMQLENQVNVIETSSMGRLFDSVASLAGIRQQINYEAQAAIEFEALVDPESTEAYSFEFNDGRLPSGDLEGIIDPGAVLAEVLEDLNQKNSTRLIAAKFHNGLAILVEQLAIKLRDQFGLNKVVLSGGVWQNMTLLEKALQRLNRQKFESFIHYQVPTNDGGIALGQAVIATHRLG